MTSGFSLSESADSSWSHRRKTVTEYQRACVTGNASSVEVLNSEYWNTIGTKWILVMYIGGFLAPESPAPLSEDGVMEQLH